MKKKMDHNRKSLWQNLTIEVTSFNHNNKNGLIGYATARINQLDLEIRNIAVYRKNGKTTISPPANPPCKENGNSWFPVMVFYDMRDFNIFQKKVVESLECYFEEHDLNPMTLESGMILL